MHVVFVWVNFCCMLMLEVSLRVLEMEQKVSFFTKNGSYKSHLYCKYIEMLLKQRLEQSAQMLPLASFSASMFVSIVHDLRDVLYWKIPLSSLISIIVDP